MSRFTAEDIALLESLWSGEMQNAMKTVPPDPNRHTSFIHIGQNSAGVRVTEESAFQVSAVWACIDVIAKAISSSDWNVYERLRNGDRELLHDDSLGYILNVRPNPEMTAQSFRRCLMIGALAWGNGYAEIVRDLAGRVSELWPILPERVDPIRRDGRLVYRVTNETGEQSWLESRDILHIRGPSIFGLVGDNMIAKAAGSIALSIATERFQQAFFGNNTQLGGILEVPGNLKDESFARLRESWDGQHKGTRNAFKAAILEGGTKFTPINPDAQKSQLVEAVNQQVESICRWFGVPPHKIQHLVKATFSNIEHLGMEFTRDGLRPWAREIQQETDYKLFSDRGRPRFTVLDLEWASQGDFKSRSEGYQTMRNIGVLSANDILRAEGKNTIGKEGDIRIINGAAIPLEDVGKNLITGAGMPAAQGDAARNSYIDVVSTVYQDLARRQKARTSDLMRNATNPSAALERFSVDQDSYIRAQLRHVCAIMSQKNTPDVIELAVDHGRRVISGEEPLLVATQFVNSILRAV